MPQEMEVTIDEKARKMTIVMPLNKNPRSSKSGKTMVIASTQGNQRTDAKYQGKEVTVGLNAYFKPDGGKASSKKKSKDEEEDDDDDE